MIHGHHGTVEIIIIFWFKKIWLYYYYYYFIIIFSAQIVTDTEGEEKIG